jgi:hypothetical protein
MLGNVVDCLLQAFPAFGAESFVEGDVGLVGDTEIVRGVYDLLVELENRVLFGEKVLRDLGDVGVETYTQIGALFLYLGK